MDKMRVISNGAHAQLNKRIDGNDLQEMIDWQQNNRRRVFSLWNPILGEIESHAAMQNDVTYSVLEFNKQCVIYHSKFEQLQHRIVEWALINFMNFLQIVNDQESCNIQMTA